MDLSCLPHSYGLEMTFTLNLSGFSEAGAVSRSSLCTE